MALPELIEGEKLFKGAVWDTLVDLGLGALFAKFPWLNIWLVRDAVRWVVTHFSDELFMFLAQTLNLVYVVLKEKSLQAKFTELALRLKGIALTEGIKSPLYLEARKQHQQVFAAHVRSLLVKEAA